MQPDPVTSMGGASCAFPLTSWTAVLHAHDPTAPEARAHLERLCRSYWKPVYGHIRWRWSKSNEEAKDLTQAFFAWFLERGGAERVEAGRGRFRNYVKVLLDNFLRDQERARRVAARGGGTRVVSIDTLEDPSPLAAPEPDFDRLWAASVLQEALRLLQERYAIERKHKYWGVFEAYYVGDARPTYDETAARLGVRPDDVQAYLKHSRAALRGIVRTIVRETVEGPAELDDEIRRLFGQ